MATKDVRVKHNGEEVSVKALVLDDTKEGGEEVWRQFSVQIGLDPRTIKVIHKGKLLKREDICQVLRDVPSQQAVVQVIGSKEKLAAEPLGRRVMALWSRVSVPVSAFVSGITSSDWWARWWGMIMLFFRGTLEFFRTFMPGHVPEPSTRRIQNRRGDGGDNEEEEVQVRVQRRVENTGQRCRDEINTEMAARFRRQDGPG